MDTEAIVAIAIVVLLFIVVPIYFLQSQKAEKNRKNATQGHGAQGFGK